MYSHRGMGAVPPSNSSRLNELLDQIRAEFDTQMRQSEGFEHQSMYSAFHSRDRHFQPKQNPPANFVRVWN